MTSKNEKYKTKKVETKTAKERDRGAASKPIALAPLAFDDALENLLRVVPEPKPNTAKKKSVTKLKK